MVDNKACFAIVLVSATVFFIMGLVVGNNNVNQKAIEQGIGCYKPKTGEFILSRKCGE